jgi:hypothetical protein
MSRLRFWFLWTLASATGGTLTGFLNLYYGAVGILLLGGMIGGPQSLLLARRRGLGLAWLRATWVGCLLGTVVAFVFGFVTIVMVGSRVVHPSPSDPNTPFAQGLLAGGALGAGLLGALVTAGFQRQALRRHHVGHSLWMPLGTFAGALLGPAALFGGPLGGLAGGLVYGAMTGWAIWGLLNEAR